MMGEVSPLASWPSPVGPQQSAADLWPTTQPEELGLHSLFDTAVPMPPSPDLELLGISTPELMQLLEEDSGSGTTADSQDKSSAGNNPPQPVIQPCLPEERRCWMPARARQALAAANEHGVGCERPRWGLPEALVSEPQQNIKLQPPVTASQEHAAAANELLLDQLFGVPTMQAAPQLSPSIVATSTSAQRQSTPPAECAQHTAYQGLLTSGAAAQQLGINSTGRLPVTAADAAAVTATVVQSPYPVSEPVHIRLEQQAQHKEDKGEGSRDFCPLPHRIKQKMKISQLEKHMRQVSAQFEQLALQNKQLKQKLGVFEAVLPVRELQISRAATASSAQQATPATVVLPQPADSCDVSLDAVPQQASVEVSCVPAVTAQNSSPADAVHLSQQHFSSSLLQVPVSEVQVADLTVGQLGQRILASTASLPTTPITDAEYRQLYLTFQKSAAHLAASWRTFPTNIVLHQLQQLVRQLLEATILTSDRGTFLRNQHVNLETGEKDFPGDAFWQAVAQQIPTPIKQQLEHAGTAMHLYDESMAAILAERQQLTCRLSQVLSKGCLASIASGAADKDCEQERLLAELDANVAAERKAAATAGDYVAMKVLTVPFYACVLVHTYPYIPDDIALTKAILSVHAGK